MSGNLLDKIYPYSFSPHKGETHQAITLGAGVFVPYLPPGATSILVQTVTQNVRYTLDGTTPTAAIGFQLAAAATPILIEITERVNLKFIREASGAVLQYCVGE